MLGERRYCDVAFGKTSHICGRHQLREAELIFNGSVDNATCNEPAYFTDLYAQKSRRFTNTDISPLPYDGTLTG